MRASGHHRPQLQRVLSELRGEEAVHPKGTMDRGSDIHGDEQ